MRDRTNAGEADAFLDIDVTRKTASYYRVVRSPFFFAAPKGDREIIDEIDATIEHINEGNPQLQNNLYKKYFLTSENNFELTHEEMQYVSHYRTLRVGVASEKAPLQSFDAKTGEFKGVTNDILQYLSKHAASRSKW